MNIKDLIHSVFTRHSLMVSRPYTYKGETDFSFEFENCTFSITISKKDNYFRLDLENETFGTYRLDVARVSVDKDLTSREADSVYALIKRHCEDSITHTNPRYRMKLY